MGDTDDDLTETEGARLYLIASVLLSFAAQVLTRRPLRPACSLGALHTYCLDNATAPRDAHCVYCALAQARVWYTLMTGTPQAQMAEALTLAHADVESRHLHGQGFDGDVIMAPAAERSASYVLTHLARTRLRAATAGAAGTPGRTPHP